MLIRIYHIHKYGWYYLRIPKCASTTVTHLFDIARRTNVELPERGLQYDYPLFCVVRNPLDRFISGYDQATRDGLSWSIDEVLEAGLSGAFRDRHLIPQHYWVYKCEEMGVFVDKWVIQDETMIEQINALTGAKFGNMRKNPRLNKHQLTEDQKNKVKRVYEKDWWLFDRAKAEAGKVSA